MIFQSVFVKELPEELSGTAGQPAADGESESDSSSTVSPL